MKCCYYISLRTYMSLHWVHGSTWYEYDTKNLFSMMKNMNEYIMTHCSALYESMLSTWFIENVYQVKYYYYY